MKITILDKLPQDEAEIILKCSLLDENVVHLLNMLKTQNSAFPADFAKNDSSKMIFYKDERIIPIDQSAIFYFESVEDRVFAYTNNCVYESRDKLYQLEKQLSPRDFMRANKSVILNLNKVQSLTPAFGSRFEAVLQNGCKIIISRMYVAKLKEILGL